ncbi:MAG: hypothetical protein ACFFBD_12180 [Candidatus Hodarchaeota archaeon]
MIHYALLHDFTNTGKHKSKIYVEPELKDLAHLKRHHDKTTDPFIQQFQKYDYLAAIISRKARSPRTSRYNWSSKGYIDFDRLVKEIKEVSNNI